MNNRRMDAPALLLGRILLSAIFVFSGWNHVTAFAHTAAGIAAHGLPFPVVLTALTVVVELAGGLMVLLGYHARWAAGIIFLWLIPVTLVYHRFWGVPDPAVAGMQMIHFMKNLAIMGGM